MTNQYWVSIDYDVGYCDEFTIEAESMADAEMKASEIMGWSDKGLIYVEQCVS